MKTKIVFLSVLLFAAPVFADPTNFFFNLTSTNSVQIPAVGARYEGQWTAITGSVMFFYGTNWGGTNGVCLVAPGGFNMPQQQNGQVWGGVISFWSINGTAQVSGQVR